MLGKNRERWARLPKININGKLLRRRVRRAHLVTVRHARKFIMNRWGSVRESQYRITKWIIVMGVLIAATGFQLMWYQKGYRTVASLEGGTYAEAVLGPLNTLNPIFANSSAENSASYLMFSRLLNYDTTGHLGYDIASSVSANSNNTVFTVKIRPDVKWHDGKALTAEDVKFTIDLIKDSSTRSTIKGWDNIAVKVIDNTTIEFSLQSAYSAFQHLLTFPILPKHILGDVIPDRIRENEFSNTPIGSGPFKISYVQEVNETTGEKVVYLVKNPSYYGGTAKLDKFQLHIYNSSDAIVKALSINEVNAAADLTPTDITEVDSKNNQTASQPIQSGVYAILNTTSTRLKDYSFRKALQLATDAASIRKIFTTNPNSLDLPLTNSQLLNSGLSASGFDVASANKMLDDLGWVVGRDGVRQVDGADLKISIVVLKDSELEKVLNALIDQWSRLNIKIETKIVDPDDAAQNVVSTILQPRNYDVLLYRLFIGADSDVFAYWHSSQANASGLNFSNYSNQIVDDALSTARTRVESDLRKAKYITFARQWLNDVPAIGLYQSTMQYVHSNEVASFNTDNVLISATDRYSDVLNWSVGTKSVYKTP